MKFNDIDMNHWKDSDINTDSLWMINARDKSGKHKNIYHGNFVPQVPYQLLQRYTKKGDVVLEPFMGSGTTLFECEKLHRRYIGFDINPQMLDYVSESMGDGDYADNFYINHCNSLDELQVDENISKANDKFGTTAVQFVLMHPPYMDIVKFTQDEDDLSQIGDIHKFMIKFKTICQNSLKHLEKGRYFAVVIGDVYKNSEVVPLGFYCMDMIKRNFKVKLKGTIVKNIEGNRGKLGSGGIWRYRALSSDYYIFKHEYIHVFKKEF
ncbi:MAG: DNA adenine methylase [Epsilonproteobacteria bacterium]|nr:MAG: DNA adenine methylase [Campylobacterota bacterium]